MTFVNPFADFVKPICLPVESKDQKRDLTGKKVLVAGWGRVANRNGGEHRHHAFPAYLILFSPVAVHSPYMPLQREAARRS